MRVETRVSTGSGRVAATFTLLSTKRIPKHFTYLPVAGHHDKRHSNESSHGNNFLVDYRCSRAILLTS